MTRFGDLVGAMRLYRHRPRIGGTRESLLAAQRQRLADVVRYAAAVSPLYRELYTGIDLGDEIDLRSLPSVSKELLMTRFTDSVCDRRLDLAGIQTHLASIRGDERYLGEYRCLSTSGTTGRPGVFVYDRYEWRAMLAMMLRYSELAETASGLGRRARVAMVTSTSPLHVTGRGAMCLALPGVPVHRIDARTSLAEIVAALNAYRPQYLSGYPSLISLLAIEQLEGRLKIAPGAVATGGEVRSEEMTANITAAWKVQPFNQYATTEGLFGSDCDHHTGIHVFEDYCLVEVVDADGRPVPDGVVGERVLFTNLIKRAQPLIRYEIDDRVALTHGLCPCGRPLARIVSLEGRSSELLQFARADGSNVTVHPHMLQSQLATIAGIRQYTIAHNATALHVTVQLRDTASAEQISQQIENKLRTALRDAGADTPEVHVEIVDNIARNTSSSGKLQQIQTLDKGDVKPA
jgi:phenylacetate-CoA ligase